MISTTVICYNGSPTRKPQILAFGNSNQQQQVHKLKILSQWRSIAHYISTFTYCPETTQKTNQKAIEARQPKFAQFLSGNRRSYTEQDPKKCET